jgi:ribonuclease HI
MKTVKIYTDGACSGNPGPGGWGAILRYGTAERELSGGEPETTNNRMELLGCIVALRQLQKPARVILYSDSRYVVDAVVKSWARRWRSQGWMRSSAKRGIRERAENSDLWEEMLAILDRQPVEFCWIRGHSSHPENERCDRLAVEAAQKRNLPVDPGFQGNCA